MGGSGPLRFVDPAALLDVVRRPWRDEEARLLVAAAAVGAATALGVVSFYYFLDVSAEAAATIRRWTGSPWGGLASIPLATGIALLVAWWVMRHLGKGHDGLNLPDVQYAIARRRGKIPLRPALARTLASAITVGGGGSAGAEGPVAVLGAALGSIGSRFARFSQRERIVLAATGGAAGISAAFNAPLAGAFFALEELLRGAGRTTFPPVVVGSVIAAVISRGVYGNSPAFPVGEDVHPRHVQEVVLLHPLLGAACGLAAALFVRAYFRVDGMARRREAVGARRPWLVPLLGGLAVGALSAAAGGLLGGTGHQAVPLDTLATLPLIAIAGLLLAKAAATAITLNAGGSGGVFMPALYLGAAIGAGCGVATARLMPAWPVSVESFALVGMGAFVAAATDAPITAVLLVFEATNDYALVPSLMLAVGVATIVRRRMERDDLYGGWLRRRGLELEQREAEAMPEPNPAARTSTAGVP